MEKHGRNKGVYDMEQKELEIYKLSSTPANIINKEIETLVQSFSDGVDYGTIISSRNNQPIGKPSLWKPGAEKVCVMFNLMPKFVRDHEVLEMLGSPKGLVALKCDLIDRTSGQSVGEGRGCSLLGDKGRDFNTTVKMAEKSAQIDAVLRTFALSQRFTQDIEDMHIQEPKIAQESRSMAQTPGIPVDPPRIEAQGPLTGTVESADQANPVDLIDDMRSMASAIGYNTAFLQDKFILDQTGFTGKDGTSKKANSIEHLRKSSKWVAIAYGKVKAKYSKFMKNEMEKENGVEPEPQPKELSAVIQPWEIKQTDEEGVPF